MSEQQPIEGEVVESASVPVAISANALPSTLFLMPMSERPFFPAQTIPVILNETPWVETVQKIGETNERMVGLVLARNNHPDSVSADEFYSVGTVARMRRPTPSDGKLQFIAEGVARFRIVRWLSTSKPYLVEVDYPDVLQGTVPDEVRAYGMAIINTIRELAPLNPLYQEELKFFLGGCNPNEPSRVADFAVTLTTASREELQDILETFPLRSRMEKVLLLVKKELDVAQIESQIRNTVGGKMKRQRRDYLLRQQLKEIRRQLGMTRDDRSTDIERFAECVVKLKLDGQARKRADEEIQKLSLLETGSAEYGVTRNYLECLTTLPWGIYSKDRLDLKRAAKILDQDHYGLEDVKQRITEFLAVATLKGQVAGSILLLVGPPGVGKTSIGRSIAKVLGRKFYRFSLGGMRDEAEIKGHRRTYIGAMPGKFLQALKEVEVSNPVIMLDEIDKVGDSYRGDPASALLEVLDPEQNADFLDHYLDVRYDLSKVLFICTANQAYPIPDPLLDRMELIRLSGYITEEKVQIAKHYLWPKLLDKVGLKRSQVQISETALRHIAEGYAREAGVRSLEKQLGRVVRKVAVQVVGGETSTIRVGIKEVETYLGKPFFLTEKPMTGVGVVTGMAWTSMGGETFSIEATRVHTKNRGFKLTGQLGDIMRESADIAHSHISANLDEYKADKEFFDAAFVHLHVPEGATPKDGPSAGVALATALLSLARNQKITRPLAMTGELTLTGKILAVGGIREKIIAAKRNHIPELILPEGNRRDYDKLPDYVRKGFTVHFVSHFREVAPLVFS